MDDFEREIKSTFLQEAAQHIADTERCFLDLEKAGNNSELIESIFRLAHNLKGGANAVGFEQFGEFTHKMESLLNRLRHGELSVSPAIIDLLLRCNDHLNDFVWALTENFEARINSDDIASRIEHFLTNKESLPSPTPATPANPTTPETWSQVPTEDELKQTEELALGQPHQSPSPQRGGEKNTSLRVSLHRLEQLLNNVGELVILQSVLQEQVQKSDSPIIRKTVHQLGKITKVVQDISMSLRMVPLHQTFQKMQRIVRDTSKALGKDVHFASSGDDTELDKSVLEQLSDPLIHLVRNAVDHGLESRQERLAAGKSTMGTVHLAAFHRLGQVVIEVRDDGRGLNPKKLIESAVRKGILRSGDNLTDDQAYNLIFTPGFSTKDVATDISGRGVGMDVVKNNIEKIHGSIQIETKLGLSTTIRIRLPTTLAIIDGMVVGLGSERYVIPLSHVFEDVGASEMKVENHVGLGEILLLRGENIPLLRLSRLLGRKDSGLIDPKAEALVVRASDTVFAVLVDAVLGHQQIVIKPLGQEFSELKGFGGSAILGDGLPALILDLPEMVKQTRESGHILRKGAAA